MRSRDDGRTGLDHPWLVLVLVVGVALGSAACTSDEPREDEAAPVVQLGAPGEPNTTLSMGAATRVSAAVEPFAC